MKLIDNIAARFHKNSAKQQQEMPLSCNTTNTKGLKVASDENICMYSKTRYPEIEEAIRLLACKMDLEQDMFLKAPEIKI